MKLTKMQKLCGLIAICIIVLAVVLTVLEATVINVSSHPVWMFFAVLTFGLGIMSLIVGLKGKNSAYIFIATILLTYFIVYALLDYAKLAKLWYVVLIIAVSFDMIMAIFGMIIAGRKTEYADNTAPDYKNYKERQAEKAIKDEQEEKEAKENLPKIKKFDD